MICFTCIWSQFVYTSFHSSQKPRQNPCRISQFSKNRGVKLITYRGLELAKSICAPHLAFISFYKITKIVRALWLAERRVCMRVCKHGCDVKMFCFSRANHASTNLKKVLSWKTRQVYFIYPFPRRLKLERSLETCCVNFFRLSWHFKREKPVFWKASFLQNKVLITRTRFLYKTSRLVRISLLINSRNKRV